MKPSSRLLEVGGYSVQWIQKPNKHVYIRINAQGQLIVTGPRHMSLADVQAIVLRQLPAIEKMQVKRQARQPMLSPESHWATQLTSVWILGQSRAVEIQQVAQGSVRRRPHYLLQPDRLLLQLAPEQHTEDHLRALYYQLHQEVLGQYLATAAQAWAQRLAVPLKGYKVRKMKSRWGSCTPSTGWIRLNSYLAQYPECCIEMVLVHELVHFYEPHHNAHFYQLLDRYLPTWRESEQILKTRARLSMPMM